ncbi:MAG: DUF2177 family protein [Lysobacteraceae bacterium]|nr:MAG: DUF2177 family protein [Xanthomonadaceae bacterium]
MWLKLYGIALPVFFAIDMLWLGVVARGFYRAQIGSLLKSDVNWVAAIVFYLVFIAGIVFFVLAPAIEKQSWRHALWAGAAFGFVTYATYDLTNLATLKGFTLTVTLVDLAWGTVLTASVATISFFIARKFGV